MSPSHKYGEEIKLLKMSKFSMHRTAGFSLVEIMVGLAIGMLAVIVILQVFALSEGRKRTTTSGGDAQSNGALMIYQLQRDIGQAGYGFVAPSMFNCNVTWPVASGATIATAVPLAPVTINPATTIIPAGDPNTDRLLIVFGNGNGQPQGNTITAQASAVYTVQMPSSFTAGAVGVGDKVIAGPTPPATCGTLIVDRITAVATNTVTAATGAVGTILYNLGPSPTVRAYAVRGQSLTVCDYMLNDCGLDANKANPAIWVPLASNIVSLKAQYARDTTATMDAVPDVFDQITPGSAADTSGIPATCGWSRTSAVRIAVVARSNQFEKGLVTTTPLNVNYPANAPTWDGNAGAPIVAATGALGPDTALDESWKHYRYKVSQTVVPIRNVTWLGVPTGC